MTSIVVTHNDRIGVNCFCCGLVCGAVVVGVQGGMVGGGGGGWVG